jgi:hypothetical protein
MQHKITTINKLRNESNYKHYITLQNKDKLFFAFPNGYAATLTCIPLRTEYDRNRVELTLFIDNGEGGYDYYHTKGGYFDKYSDYVTFTEAEDLLDKIYRGRFYEDLPTEILGFYMIKPKLNFNTVQQFEIPYYTVTASFRSLPKTITNYITNDGLDLDPPFQRGYVWSEKQRTDFMEYVLRNVLTG